MEGPFYKSLSWYEKGTKVILTRDSSKPFDLNKRSGDETDSAALVIVENEMMSEMENATKIEVVGRGWIDTWEKVVLLKRGSESLKGKIGG